DDGDELSLAHAESDIHERPQSLRAAAEHLAHMLGGDDIALLRPRRCRDAHLKTPAARAADVLDETNELVRRDRHRNDQQYAGKELRHAKHLAPGEDQAARS